MAGERARVFVALELPGLVRAELADWTSRVTAATPGLRAVPCHSLHVTLCFLGLLPIEQTEAVARACECVRGRPVSDLALDDVLWLPRRRPRVLAIALVDPHGQLAGVQAALGEALEAAGAFTPEDRRFLAHVTVARVGRAARVKGNALEPPPADRFDAHGVTLFRSHLGRGPARYEPLHRVSLSGGIIPA